MIGFDTSFYGFFAAAVAWLAIYFTWSFAAAARDHRRRR